MTHSLSHLLAEAHQAGLDAGNRAIPTPMGITDGINTWVMSEGSCGFAWVTIKGTGPLAKAAKAEGWTKGYPKGLQLWVGEFNQSVTRKDAYARAYAKVLQLNGFEARPGSRLD